VRTRGWTEGTGVTLWDGAGAFSHDGPEARAVQLTSIATARSPAPISISIAARWRATRASHGRPPAGVREAADLAALAALGMAAAVSGQGAARTAHHFGGAATILAKRIIPCLDVRERPGRKGCSLPRPTLVVGDILDLAARYRDEGADELVFYDITASPERPLGRSRLGHARCAGSRYSLLRGRRHSFGGRSRSRAESGR